MNSISYNNIIPYLLERFPEYKDSPAYLDAADQDSPYSVLGNLSMMAFGDDNMGMQENIELAEELVRLTDEIFNNKESDDDLVNLFAIEILERFISSRKNAMLAKRLLHGKSINLLEQTLQNYNAAPEFLEEYRKNGGAN